MQQYLLSMFLAYLSLSQTTELIIHPYTVAMAYMVDYATRNVDIFVRAVRCSPKVLDARGRCKAAIMMMIANMDIVYWISTMVCSLRCIPGKKFTNEYVCSSRGVNFERKHVPVRTRPRVRRQVERGGSGVKSKLQEGSRISADFIRAISAIVPISALGTDCFLRLCLRKAVRSELRTKSIWIRSR